MGKKHTCKNLRELQDCVKEITDIVLKYKLCNIERRQLLAILEYMETATSIEKANIREYAGIKALKEHLNEETPGVT